MEQNDGNPIWNGDRDRTSTQSPNTMDMKKMLHPSGRNKRSVWNVATVPFKEAHFATFPEELITPCILAGTSEKGACAACGDPYERVTENGELGGEAKIQATDRPAAEVRGVSKTSALRTNGRTWRKKTEKGWVVACKCEADVAPCVVLDPFMGAGTTALVSATYGRRFVGCELNPDYKAIADKRIANEVAQDKFL